ncbi:hypothetical protein, partial [Streptomyces rectiviolaceus]
QLSVARGAAAAGAVDAGPAAAAGAEQAMTADYIAAPATESAGSVTDGGAAPAFLAELVRLADAGEVARPGEEPQQAGRSSEFLSMDAGSAPPAPG